MTAPRVAPVCKLEACENEFLLYARDLWRERKAAAERGEFSRGTAAEIMASIRARIERSA